MADTKLSALTELAATPADDDEVYIRDVSEAAAAESKRITILNLLGNLVAHIAATVVHGAVSAATASKIIIRDAAGRAKVVAPSAEDDIALKSNVTTVNTALTTHGNLTTAHSAVSTATASRMVVRDASARAKFAAPAASGDALIKGTALTITEMAALTTGKIWLGVANRPVASDLPAGGAAIAAGTYTGNDANDRQISVGFKCSHVWVARDGANAMNIWGTLPHAIQAGAPNQTELQLHATDGFVVDQDSLNYNTYTYYYWAISE